MAKKKDTSQESDFFDDFPEFPDAEEASKSLKLELRTPDNKTGRKRDFGDLPVKRVFHMLPESTIKAFQQAVPESSLKPNQLLNEMIWEYLVMKGYVDEREEFEY